MNNAKYILFFLTLITLLSCQDFFIRELEIPRQDLDDQLVVHAFISDLDSSLLFIVSNNYDLDEKLNSGDSLINQAQVSIFRNDELLTQFGQNELGEYRWDLTDDFQFSPGDYRFEIEHPNYEKAIIETDLPGFIEPDSIIFTPGGGFATPNSNSVLDLLEISFIDPPNEENYYEFQINQVLVDKEIFIFPGDTQIIEKRYPNRFFSPDSNFEQGISGFTISDKDFDGERYSFQVMLATNKDLEDVPYEDVKLHWNCISKDHYEYSLSLNQYQASSAFGLFSDPIAIYSNVDNGLGIISLRSKKELSILEK